MLPGEAIPGPVRPLLTLTHRQLLSKRTLTARMLAFRSCAAVLQDVQRFLSWTVEDRMNAFWVPAEPQSGMFSRKSMASDGHVPPKAVGL